MNVVDRHHIVLPKSVSDVDVELAIVVARFWKPEGSLLRLPMDGPEVDAVEPSLSGIDRLR
jgi:hypothetical protein